MFWSFLLQFSPPALNSIVEAVSYSSYMSALMIISAAAMIVGFGVAIAIAFLPRILRFVFAAKRDAIHAFDKGHIRQRTGRVGRDEADPVSRRFYRRMFAEDRRRRL